jgi:hypothetical protein
VCVCGFWVVVCGFGFGSGEIGVFCACEGSWLDSM